MDPVTTFLVAVAGLFLLGALGEVIFARTQIPDVVWLILAGILLGPIGGIVPREMMARISPFFGALALIVILFDGGSKLVLKDLMKAAPRASALAVGGFVGTVVVIALLSLGFAAVGALDEWSVTHGVMLGAILGGSSSLIIMPSMALAKIEEKVANLVNLESAFTDALCVVVTVAMIDVLAAGKGSAGTTAWVLARSFGIAGAIGVATGWMWMPVLRLISGRQHAYPMTMAALILLYVTVDALGGSAAMGILAFAVMVGNAEPIMKRLGYSRGAPLEIDVSVRTVHSQISFIVKSFFFTFIGLMLEPPWSLLALGVLLGFALLAARGPVVRLVTRGGEFDAAQRKLITIALPRGMAAGVLATMPAYHGIAGTEHLPSMVFAAVITSIAIYAVGLPMVRRTRANSPSGGNRRRVPPEVATPLASEAPAVRTAASESVPAPQWDANPPTPEQASGSALPLL